MQTYSTFIPAILELDLRTKLRILLLEVVGTWSLHPSPSKSGPFNCFDHFFLVNPECDICEKAVRVPIRSSELLSQKAFKEKYFDPGFSVIVRNVETYGSTNHTYGEFLDTYYENQKIMDEDACEFYLRGEAEKPKNLGDLLEHWEHFKPEGHVVGW